MLSTIFVGTTAKEKGKPKNSEGIDPLLLEAMNAARREVAKEFLDEIIKKDNGPAEDAEWAEDKLKDLDAFVKANLAALDEMLKQQGKPVNEMDVDGTGKRARDKDNNESDDDDTSL